MIIGLILSNTPAQSETFLISKIKGLQEMGHQVALHANKTEDFYLCQTIPHPKPGNNDPVFPPPPISTPAADSAKIKDV